MLAVAAPRGSTRRRRAERKLVSILFVDLIGFTAGADRADPEDAARLRAVEHAYRTGIERDSIYVPPEPPRTLRPTDHVADRQIDFEAEP